MLATGGEKGVQCAHRFTPDGKAFVTYGDRDVSFAEGFLSQEHRTCAVHARNFFAERRWKPLLLSFYISTGRILLPVFWPLATVQSAAHPAPIVHEHLPQARRTSAIRRPLLQGIHVYLFHLKPPTNLLWSS